MPEREQRFMSNQSYIFEGHVIRLNEKDYQAWREMMSGAGMSEQQFLEELSSIDVWLSKQRPSKKKSWFFLTSTLLRRKL